MRRTFKEATKLSIVDEICNMHVKETIIVGSSKVKDGITQSILGFWENFYSTGDERAYEGGRGVTWAPCGIENQI